MFISLSKKIAFPNDTQLHCVSWSKTHGYIAIGGDGDFLKVVHLDTQNNSITVLTNVKLTGGDRGHGGNVLGVIWNEEHQKLTTYDGNGLIIVWVLDEGTWYEDMISQRLISYVRGIVWDKTGKNVCIVYEDGYVIVGDVDGGRSWAKELLLARIIFVEWSPGGNSILFGLISGEVHIYDKSGSFLCQLEIPHLQCSFGPDKIAGIQWYNGLGGYCDPQAPSLAVCLKYGRCQIMKDVLDRNPTFIDTKMMIAQMAWNHDGSILAFAGSQKREGETKRFSVIEFYDPYGSHLRTLDVPGKKLTSCSWGPNSQYLAIVIDSNLYLASNKADHKLGYCSTGNTLVYAFKPQDKEEHCVVFFEIRYGEKYVNYVNNLISFATSSDYCCLASKVDDKYVLALCDSIGTPIDSKSIKLQPIFLTVTKTHVIAASRKAFYAWQFKSIPIFPGDTSGRCHKGFERVVYIADDLSEARSGDHSTDSGSRIFDDEGEEICSICASDKFLIVGCVSGTINIFEMPMVKFSKKHCLNYSAQQLSLNSTSRRLSIIDFTGNLTIFDLEGTVIEAGERVIGKLIDFKKSDVRHMRWAEDLHDRFVVMDKTKKCVFVDCDEVDSPLSNGYVCQYNGNRVMTALMNDIMDDPENPKIDHVKNKTVSTPV